MVLKPFWLEKGIDARVRSYKQGVKFWSGHNWGMENHRDYGSRILIGVSVAGYSEV